MFWITVMYKRLISLNGGEKMTLTELRLKSKQAPEIPEEKKVVTDAAEEIEAAPTKKYTKKTKKKED